ncbi:hypothetical protein ACJJIX_00025 [Microbulbifer sp. VAAC004]|uniref:hypothetical protein n=1 Tax=unclassified Microbulbifer TaxID=2619833 RepID=UPI004039D083
MALTATDSPAGAAARGILGRIGQALFGTPVGAGVVAAIFPTQMGNGELTEEDHILGDAYSAGMSRAETQAKNLRNKNPVAVIGEGQEDRVIPYARAVNGISFSISERYKYESAYMQGFDDAFKERISVTFNKGWIHGVMNAGLEIHDIGAHPARGGIPTSPWYLAEREAIAIREYPTYRVKFK